MRWKVICYREIGNNDKIVYYAIKNYIVQTRWKDYCYLRTILLHKREIQKLEQWGATFKRRFKMI